MSQKNASTRAPLGPDGWLAERQTNTRSPLSEWESDATFITLALQKWPVDMMSVGNGGYGSQTPRMRMRLRHQAFVAVWEILFPAGGSDGA